MSREGSALVALAGLCASAGLASAGAPFPISPALEEGDSVTGVGLVTRLDNLAINSNGSWIVEADTDNSDTTTDSVLVKNSALFLQEGQALADPAGASVGSFDAVNLSSVLNNMGNSAFNLFLDGTTGSSDDSGIYYNDKLVIQESDISTAPEFTAGTPYIGWFGAHINDSDQILMIASVDDPAINSTVDRALVRVDYDAGTGNFTETVLAKEGDMIAGAPVLDFGTGEHQSAWNNAGDALYVADRDTGDSSTDNALVMNSTVLAVEGDPSPIGGRDWEFLSSRGLDLNNNGDYVHKANLTGDTADDEVIIVNGAVFKQEGDAPPTIGGGFAITSFGTGSGPVEIADTGDVLWFADWNDTDTDIDTGLFLNDMLLVQEGVTMVDGVIVDTISSGQDAFQLSDNGEWVIFEATLDDGTNGAYTIHIPAPGSAALLAVGGLAMLRRRR